MYDLIIENFAQIEHFLNTLGLNLEAGNIPESLLRIFVKIFAAILRICGIATSCAKVSNEVCT